MEIREAEALIRRTYLERDSKRGLPKNFMWFVEEVGEFAQALRKGDKEALENEAADVFAWFLSVLVQAGVDLEEAFSARYGKGCPACASIPCRCPERPFHHGER